MTTAQLITRPVEILLVEDSPSDALLAQEALRQGSVTSSVHHVADGVEALSFLRRSGEYSNAPRPDLILLDLNMPRMDGFAVLKEVRTDEDLQCIPIVVMTTSTDARDIENAYRYHANSYICKPVAMSDFVTAMRSLEQFWLTWAALPVE